jgi:drug/metabolite transporter (DMT)-like permease
MLPSNIIGIIFGLLSATTWGVADYFGGISTRKYNSFAVLVVSAFSGTLLLILCSFIWPEPFPKWPEILWAVLAGVSALVALSSLYKALTFGQSAVVASMSSVIGATLPVIYGIFISGLPDAVKVIGFFMAISGIWFVSRASHGPETVKAGGMALAILAGIGFGVFFIVIPLAGPKLTFTPLIICRTTYFIIALFLLVLFQKKELGKAANSPLIWLNGFFDISGTALFMLARQFTRFEIAVILTSLYPVITVLLFRIFHKEHISYTQWLGVGLCFGAVILISI